MELGLQKILKGILKNPSKITTIAEAWIVAAKPQVWQKELANDRYNICLDCEHYRKSRPVTNDEYCNDCGCPISKKIFSQQFRECPQNKWEPVEIEYKNKLHKKNKSIV